MKKIILFVSIILMPSLVFATEVEVTNEVAVEVQNEVEIDIGESLKISKPLKKSSLKGFLVGEVGKFKFHIRISRIGSIVYITGSKVTLINVSPIYGINKTRTRIVVKNSVMSYEQVIKLIQSSESLW